MSKARFTAMATDVDRIAFQEAAQLLLQVQKEKMPAIFVACREASLDRVGDIHHIRMNNSKVSTTVMMVAAMVDMLAKGCDVPVSAILGHLQRAVDVLRAGPVG